MASRGHDGRRWRHLRAKVIGSDWDGPLVCHLCRRVIDRDAEPRTPAAPSVDLIVPWSDGGDPLDVSNLRAAHFGCNSKRRNKPVHQWNRPQRQHQHHARIPRDPARAPAPPLRRWTSEDAP